MKINDDEIAGAIYPEGEMRDDPDRVRAPQSRSG